MIVVERRRGDVKALVELHVDPVTLADDGFDWNGVVVPKPWGQEEQIHRCGAVSIWRLTLAPGAETSMHCHPNKRTALIVESGVCVIETLAGRHVLHPGEMAHIEPGAFHRTKAGGGAVVIEIESPANKRDLVRLADKYGRGQGYERAACA